MTLREALLAAVAFGLTVGIGMAATTPDRDPAQLNQETTIGAPQFPVTAVAPAPKRYHGNDTVAKVAFINQYHVNHICNQDGKGFTLACTYVQSRQIIMPNPCVYSDTEFFARLMCHELAHLHGWKHEQ